MGITVAKYMLDEFEKPENKATLVRDFPNKSVKMEQLFDSLNIKVLEHQTRASWIKGMSNYCIHVLNLPARRIVRTQKSKLENEVAELRKLVEQLTIEKYDANPEWRVEEDGLYYGSRWVLGVSNVVYVPFLDFLQNFLNNDKVDVRDYIEGAHDA